MRRGLGLEAWGLGLRCWRRTQLSVVLALGLGPGALGLLSASQARDSRREAVAGTATVSGVVVTDERTPQEVKRARIELAAEGQLPLTVFTDDRGRFAVSKVPAGRYMLAATKPGYVRVAYGAKRADRPGTPIMVADGQQLTNVVLKMARGAVITGTIRDDLGQPVQGVRVAALQYRMQNGERVLMPALSLSGPLGDATDDLGAYRLFGLSQGDYVVSASPRPLGSSDVRQMTPAEIQSVQQALQQPPLSAGINTPGPAARPEPVTVTYAPVYYPGTTAALNAVTVTVASGEERSGVDMSLQLVRTARIEGVVVTPNGVPPQTAQLLMLPRNAASSGAATMITFNRVAVGSDGKFIYTGIAPGQYTISARIGGAGVFITPPDMGGSVSYTTGVTTPMRTDQPGPIDGRGRNASATGALWAMADVTVDGNNITGLTLNMQPGLPVTGRVVVEAVGVDAPDDLSRARVSLTPAGTGGLMVGIGGTGGQVDRSGRFTLPDVTPGKYRVSTQLSTPEATWTLKSAILNGKESLDFPVEIGPNDRAGEAVVTFTNQNQQVGGTLSDAAGRPAPDFTIVIFPADKAYWLSARRIRTARPDTDGKFSVPNLPTGDYRIAALVDIAPGEQTDPAFLEQLVPASITFSLHDGEKKVQDIRIAGGSR